LEQSFIHARNCDLFLTIGSSLVVQPASLLPVEAKRGGAPLVLVNLSSTTYDPLMDVIINEKAGPAMDAVMAEFRSLTGGG
jgi:NAD-dependent deacetylase